MELYLTPPVAIVLLIVAVSCGHVFRDNWKNKPQNWKQRAWLFGCPACVSLLVLGFVPLKF